MQNQYSSWNDDPFELNGAVKGVTSLSNSRNLYFYAEELVSTYAKFDGECYNITFSDLPDYAKNELSRLYMEFTDRDTGECVHGEDLSIDNDYTCALLSMLKNDCHETRQAFAEITRKNIISYYESSLQKLLDGSCHDYLHNQNNEIGYFSHQSQETGDVVWSRF